MLFAANCKGIMHIKTWNMGGDTSKTAKKKKMRKKVLTREIICDIMYRSPRESGGVKSEKNKKVFKKT